MLKTASANAHCRAPLQLPLPPAPRIFLTRQFLWRQALLESGDDQEVEQAIWCLAWGARPYNPRGDYIRDRVTKSYRVHGCSAVLLDNRAPLCLF